MRTNRRSFLINASAGSLAAGFTAGANARVSANDTIQVGLIGAGGMGQGDATTATSIPGVRIVAACDVYDGRLQHARELWGDSILTTRDYRELLARKDVDAVIVATPDHWHARISVDALNAGKDVYCQKPMVQRVEDGQAVIEAQKKTGRILQVGSQRVSSILYQKARDLIQAGEIGRVSMVEAWIDRNTAAGAWQYAIPLDASPENIAWDRFLGDAPKRPFEPIRLFRWRNYRDYGTGVGGDLFVHLFSGIHRVLDSLGPVRILATGGLRFWNDGRDVPDTMIGMFDYPANGNQSAFNLALRVNLASGAGPDSGFRFLGDAGSLTLGNSITLTRQGIDREPGGNVNTLAQAGQEAWWREHRTRYAPKAWNPQSMQGVRADTYAAPPGYSDQLHHHQNFFAAVRGRLPVVEDAVFGFRAAVPALLANRSCFDRRIYEWDPVRMESGAASARLTPGPR